MKKGVFIIIVFLNSFSLAQTANWIELGPFQTPDLLTSNLGSRGIGRTSCIRFHPDFASNGTLFVGSPLGGLWKRTLGSGSAWEIMNADALPNIGISDIIVDSNNPLIIYVSTGDPDAPMDFNRTYLGNTAEHSRGIFRSMDGGITWSLTAIGNWYDLNSSTVLTNFWDFPSQKKARRIAFKPGSSSEIYSIIETYNWAAHQPVSYLYKSDNSGLDWYIKHVFLSEKLSDLEFCPSDPEIMFLSGISVYKSVDGGENWSESANGLSINAGVERSEIEMSESNDNTIYVLCSNPTLHFNYLYISTDRGDSYSIITQLDKSPPSRTSLAVDETDVNNIYVTTSNYIKRVVNVNGIWSVSPFYLPIPHMDVHELKFEPNTNVIYASTDGGLSVSYDNGSTWVYLNEGLRITQLWDIDTDENEDTKIIIGTQDNGTILHDGDIGNLSNSWSKIMGGDGFTTLIDNSEAKYYYHTDAQTPGVILRSNDNGYSWTSNLRPPGTTSDDSRFPLVQHPEEFNVMYVGFENVFKSIDYGLSWTQITNVPATQKVKNIAICELKPEHIYFNYGYTIWHPAPLEGWFWYSPDGGVTWLDRTPGLEGLRGGEIGGIAVDPYNPLRVIVSFKGTVHRMMCSNDGGMTWTDFMQGLPDDADFYGLCTEKGSKNIYAAASNGVYVYNDDVGQWQAFNHLLPRVWVLSTKINYRSNEIFAATHGRGAWKSHLFCPINTDLFLTGIVQSNKIEESIGNLVSEEKIAANQEVTYRSTYEVTLTAGFEAAEGSDFTAFIRDCVTGRSSMRTASELSDEEIGNRTGWKELNLLVAPNPVKESFCIKLDLFSDLNWMKYDVINVSGTVIANGKLGGDVKVVDSSSWNSGIYYIIVYTNVGKVVRKIVKI